jgi:hypothetical protein
MMKRKVVYFGLFLFTVCLIFSKQAGAEPSATFNVEFENGKVHVTGKGEGFECIPPFVDYEVSVSITGDIEAFNYYDKNTRGYIEVDTYDELSCQTEGNTIEYQATYIGGEFDGEQCLRIDPFITLQSSVTPPAWTVEFIKPSGGTVECKIENITIDYNFFAYSVGNRYIEIKVCKKFGDFSCDTIVSESGIPPSSRIETHYDFTDYSANDKFDIKVKQGCELPGGEPIETYTEEVCIKVDVNDCSS